MPANPSLTTQQSTRDSKASAALPAAIVAAAIGVALLALFTTWLWWRYGTALFVDLAISALNICF